MPANRLHLAAFDGDEETVNRLLAKGTDPNSRTNQGETPLLFATALGHTGVVRSLLKYGADVNALPIAGASALRVAVQNGHAEIVRLLLARGADPALVPLPHEPTEEEKAKTEAQMKKFEEKLTQENEILSRLGFKPATSDGKSREFIEKLKEKQPQKQDTARRKWQVSPATHSNHGGSSGNGARFARSGVSP